MFHIPRLGFLRAALALLTVLLILAAPLALGEQEKTGWGLFTTVIVPALMPMLVFVLPLDMTMARVLMSGQSAEERQRLRAIIRFEAILLLLLLLAWTPFMYRMLA